MLHITVIQYNRNNFLKLKFKLHLELQMLEIEMIAPCPLKTTFHSYTSSNNAVYVQCQLKRKELTNVPHAG